MELKELTEKTLELFEAESADQLGQRLLESCKDTVGRSIYRETLTRG